VNILLVNWNDLENPQAGGAEIHLFEIFSRLAARGHRVRLICSGWKGAPRKAVVQGIEIERSGGRNTFALLGRGAVRRALRAEPADVVVEDVNKLPLFLAGLTRLPFCVIVPHLFGAAAFEEAAWPVASVVWLAERPLPRMYRRAGFHAISESTRDDLVARGVPASRIRVIHPGTDTRAYTPLPGLDRTPQPSFLYVGRLRRYKGVSFAIRALAAARRVRPDIVLDIAGSGDGRPQLEALARSLGVAESVRFLGFIPHEAKLRLLRTCWANLYPSVKEGWGITVIEAAACGTPSIASNSPGLRDSVRDGVTGHLVAHGDVDALARRMLEYAEHPSLVDFLGRNGRAHAESLTWDATADATEAHLAELVAGAAAASHPS
jgi:glycosyltransferase involved in cell wall biosynthesis